MNREDFIMRFEALKGAMLTFLRTHAIDDTHRARLVGDIVNTIEKAHLPAEPQAPRQLPGCRHLQAALALARGGPMENLARAFADLEPALRWIRTEHYREQLGDEYMNNYCYTNILGYDALIPHERIIIAFFIIGPGRHYPRHHHGAEEIYFPFGGDTLWGQNDQPPCLRPPGQPIHNTPWLPHEMVTQQTPLFSFCCWKSAGPLALARLT
ncbi:MAG: hypothetical protein GKR94_24280 [Gammaproteobacteria bacterium]|nr:hypothetical protein [Gammaproteobacteria bacterium]